MTGDPWCRRAGIVAGVHPEEFQFGENSVAASVTNVRGHRRHLRRRRRLGGV
jgi:hypothetical protein